MKSSFYQRLYVVLFLIGLFQLPRAFAQGGKGSISGTVTDSSHAVLPGARIEIDPAARKAVTDGQGQFRISELPAGTYKVSISYVGFIPEVQSVTVSAGQVATFDAALRVSSVWDEVIVSGVGLQREAEAVNIQRTAENIVQVLPSQVIMSLPNTNIADAVGRLPSVTLERDEGEGKYVQIRGTEPRLSNTTIDGVNVPAPESGPRNVKLDVIPAALVDRIEVNKTLSANQDGDAIGGSVNLVTKSAGDRPTFTLGAQGGYTPIQNGRWLDAFDATDGRRVGTSKKFGALLSGSYDWNGRGINDIEPPQGRSTEATGNNF